MPGSGGGSGARLASGTAGGGGGDLVYRKFATSDLSSSVSVTVGPEAPEERR
jgi:hypothetical protein